MSYKLINTRSPFYVQYASTEASVSLDLTVWTGTISSKPSASYQMSKEPTSGAATFEIAELIRDYISHNSNTAGRVWVEVSTYDGVAATVTDTYLASEGYTLYSEGMQHEGTISTVTGYALPEESAFDYRMLLPENTAGVVSSLVYTATNAGTDDTANQITYTTVGTAATQIQKTENAVTYTVVIDRLPCSKYDVAKLRYINKFGAFSDFYFSLKSMETLNTSSDAFLRSLNDFSSLSNNNGLHANRKRITGSKQSFRLNTDFINEYYVKQLEELFLSEYVWLDYDGDTIPVNIQSNTLEKKKHVNDKLIQYEFSVETAAEYLNMVR